MSRSFGLLTAFVVLAIAAAESAHGQVLVAREDFDGGDLNLISSMVPALDGGGGDWFGVGNRNAWPQGFPDPGVPFSIGDDTVFGYSNGGDPFPADTEGIYGQNSNLDNNYFAMSDTRKWAPDELSASWTFDISGFTDLRLNLGMGGVSNDSFDGYSLDTEIMFTARIDGGAAQIVFALSALDPNGFLTRLMDNGNQSGGGRLLEALGDNAVTKLLAESGSPADNTLLDKTPPSGAGAGMLDIFATDLNGTGSTLVLTLTANMPFEAMVFDNIVIMGVPEPATLSLLVLGGLALVRRR